MPTEILGRTCNLTAQFEGTDVYEPEDSALPVIMGGGAIWEAGGCLGKDPSSALLAWHTQQETLVRTAEQALDQALLSGRALLAALGPEEEELRDKAETDPL